MVKNYSIKIIVSLMLILGAISLFYIYMLKNQHDQTLERVIDKERERAKASYLNALETLYKKYQFIADNIVLDPKLIDAVKTRNHDALLAFTKPYYERFKQDNPYLGVMHFHTVDNKSLLRLHDPMIYEDDLSQIRPMIAAANKAHTVQKGLEVGKYGVFYRIAVPISDANQHIGVLEFGVSIDYIVDEIAVHDQMQAMFFAHGDAAGLIEKFQLKKHATLGALIATSAPFFEEFDALKELNGRHLLMTHQDKTLICFKGSLLLNYEGAAIGTIFLVKEIDYITRGEETLLVTFILSGIVLMVLSFLILNYVFGKYARHITAQHKQLLLKTRAMEKLANHDFLTKTYNRRRIDEVLRQECIRTHRYETPLSIILFDIDDFKKINDTFGHNNGDKVLRILAKTLLATIRQTDFLGRWGGEEFILVLPQTPLNQAVELAHKLREKITMCEFGFIPRITCSFGVTQCHKDDTIETSIHHADDALYDAKNSGKNCVKVWKGEPRLFNPA